MAHRWRVRPTDEHLNTSLNFLRLDKTLVFGGDRPSRECPRERGRTP